MAPNIPVHKNITAMPLPAPLPTSLRKNSVTVFSRSMNGSNT